MTQNEKRVAPRDFGLLKVRNLSIKQSNIDIVKAGETSTNFDRMDNGRLINIIKGQDIVQKRALSKWFSQVNGIYGRTTRYLSDIYKFDHLVYPDLAANWEEDESKNDAVLEGYEEVLQHLDKSSVQTLCRKWANQVCTEGVYYGYICEDVPDKLVIQDLPTEFCRSRFYHRGRPVIEFNVSYFDKITRDDKYRKRILLLFPKEFQVGYKQFSAGKTQPEIQGEQSGWIILDVNRAFKFSFDDSELPPFLSAIPSLLELDEIQDLEKEKLIQQIQKILVQKFELDKNGEIPFTMGELQRLNQNAIDMVGDAVGVSVLSTVADVTLEDLGQDGKESRNNVEISENTVYNSLGVSSNLFNTGGNLALEKSIAIDEAFVRHLVYQFQEFFSFYLEWNFSNKDYGFKFKMLNTTIFNYVALSDKYKELTKVGFSRFLPLVALGHSQKEVSSLARFEQQIMGIDTWMLPPFSTNTMSSQAWRDVKSEQEGEGSDKNGRPEKPNEEKSDKTLANQASIG